MADTEQVVGIDTTASLIEQLGKACLDLETCKKNVPEDQVQWMEIQEHFRTLEATLKKKTEEIEAKEKEFEAKESETRTMLVEREAAVGAKEQELLDRVQELKDAAVAAIGEAREKHKPIFLEPINGGDNNESKVSSSFGDTNALISAPEEQSPHKTGENAEGVAVEVKPRPELTQFCEQMDAKGLLNFTLENQKILSVIRDELSVALKSATEPSRLVLDSLEGFYPPDETAQPGDVNDAALQGMRQSCIMIMEAMATILAKADPGADHLLNPEIKQQAKAIADEWKPKLANVDTDSTNINSLEAEAFLQLLATFRIASEFDEEELCKLVLAVAGNMAPELCHTLGLTHKMPGVIEVLINSGKQIEAVHFVQAFQLTETFPPVPLLKTYLKDLRRNSQGKGGNTGGADGGQTDVNAQELAAVKAVIKCIEQYKLEADYPLDPLQRRVAQLDKPKSDKKRSGDFGKHQQSKKSRPNGGSFGFRGRGGGAATAAAGARHIPPFGDRLAYMERYAPHHAAVPNTYNYQVPGQPLYPQQTTDQRSYYYPQDDSRAAPTSYNGVAAASAATSNYGSYVGGGLPSNQPYM